MCVVAPASKTFRGDAINPGFWCRAVLRMDWRNRRLAKDFEATIDSARRLPLRRIRHAARASDRSCFMTFETDSKALGEHLPRQR